MPRRKPRSSFMVFLTTVTRTGSLMPRTNCWSRSKNALPIFKFVLWEGGVFQCFSATCVFAFNYWFSFTFKFQGDFNIIIVDWSTGAQWPYEQAAGNVFLVGAELSHLLKHLHDHGGVNYADVHIIGHSLGAHIAGLAGHPLTSIGRITGMVSLIN